MALLHSGSSLYTTKKLKEFMVGANATNSNQMKRKQTEQHKSESETK